MGGTKLPKTKELIIDPVWITSVFGSCALYSTSIFLEIAIQGF